MKVSGKPASPLQEISNRLVGLHKRHYGKGPTKARTFVNEDVVICVLEGGFTQAEATLQAHGHEEAVHDGRNALQDSLRAEFVAVVEQALWRPVISFMSANDPSRQLQVEIFVLGRDFPADDAGEALARTLGAN
jgi:uncharacterized protein YbcI